MAERKNDATKRIDAYGDEVPVWAQPICAKLRRIIHKAAPDIVESWKWGGPVFERDGLVCGYRAFQRHVALHFFNGAAIDDDAGLLEGCPGTANARRIVLRDAREVTQKALLPYVKSAVALNAAGVKPLKAEIVATVPPELERALARSAAAKRFFDGLAPGYRRDFCVHIAEAKRADTRSRRVEKVMNLLKAKRRLNDQYR